MPTPTDVIHDLALIARDFATATIERQKRRHLEAEDFEQLRAAGFLLTGVPMAQGGLWQDPAGSARDYGEMVRTVAHGDPSVALVAAMHPAVMLNFLAIDTVDDHPAAWAAQRQWAIDTARSQWWGTLTSEPGSGGDVLKTRTTATPRGDQYLLSGDKHFGSGSGQAAFMLTTARIDAAAKPELFFLQHRDVPWDGSSGCKMTVAWDGMGMAATQSHAFRLQGFPATKFASTEVLDRIGPVASQIGNMLFTAVALGVADNAMAFARQKLDGKIDSMGAFEKTEWVRCQNELWLAEQAYQGALYAIEANAPDAAVAALRCKVTCSELLEAALGRMAKVVGGASYSRALPLAQWTEDIKALGFLRPPLPLAYHQLLEQ